MRYTLMIILFLNVALASATGAASKTTPVCARPAGQNSDKKSYGQKAVTFIELGSVNCVPCRMMQPVLANIEKNYGNRVAVIFYDVWTAQGRPYASKYNVRAIPTQVFLDANGKEFYRHTGFLAEEDIARILKTRGVK